MRLEDTKIVTRLPNKEEKDKYVSFAQELGMNLSEFNREALESYYNIRRAIQRRQSKRQERAAS